MRRLLLACAWLLGALGGAAGAATLKIATRRPRTGLDAGRCVARRPRSTSAPPAGCSSPSTRGR